MATKSISQLTEVTSDLGTDKLEIAKVDALSASGYTSGSTTVDKLGAYINGTKTFSTLPTTDKTIVGSLSECFQSVSDGKTLIATAITDKGVQTAATDSFSTMATNISNISGGGGITPTGTIQISANGTYDVTQYASADVSTPVPTGTFNITTNGTYDVSQYANASVSVPSGGGYPSRTLTFTSDTAYQITINIAAYFFKNASRTLSVSVNGGTAITLTSTVPLLFSEYDFFTIQDNCVVGTNTIEVTVSNSDIYVSQIMAYDKITIPYFIDSGTGANTVYDSSTITSTTTITDGEDTIIYKTSADTIYGGGTTPHKAFDGNRNTYWQANRNTATGHWLKFELPQAKYMPTFYITNGDSNAFGPGNILLQGSNDNTNWDDLEQFTLCTRSQAGQEKTVYPHVVGSYKYYKWSILTLYSGSNIGELICNISNLYANETW